MHSTLSREGLYVALAKIRFPPKLLRLGKSVHQNVKATVQFDIGLSLSPLHQKRGKVRVRPSTDPLRDLFLNAPQACF